MVIKRWRDHPSWEEAFQLVPKSLGSTVTVDSGDLGSIDNPMHKASTLSVADRRDGDSNDHHVSSTNSLRSAPTKVLVVPSPSSLSLKDLTVEAFYERFCGVNPDQRRTPDWDIVLDCYEKYVVKYYGRDTLENILAAYGRCHLRIPDVIKYRHYQQVEDQIRRKELSNRAFADAKPDARSRDDYGYKKQMELDDDGELHSRVATKKDQTIRLQELNTSTMRTSLPSSEGSSRALVPKRIGPEKPLSRAIAYRDSRSQVYRPGAFASMKRPKDDVDEAIDRSNKRLKSEQLSPLPIQPGTSTFKDYSMHLDRKALVGGQRLYDPASPAYDTNTIPTMDQIVMSALSEEPNDEFSDTKGYTALPAIQRSPKQNSSDLSSRSGVDPGEIQKSASTSSPIKVQRQTSSSQSEPILDSSTRKAPETQVPHCHLPINQRFRFLQQITQMTQAQLCAVKIVRLQFLLRGAIEKLHYAASLATANDIHVISTLRVVIMELEDWRNSMGWGGECFRNGRAAGTP